MDREAGIKTRKRERAALLSWEGKSIPLAAEEAQTAVDKKTLTEKAEVWEEREGEMRL